MSESDERMISARAAIAELTRIKLRELVDARSSPERVIGAGTAIDALASSDGSPPLPPRRPTAADAIDMLAAIDDQERVAPLQQRNLAERRAELDALSGGYEEAAYPAVRVGEEGAKVSGAETLPDEAETTTRPSDVRAAAGDAGRYHADQVRQAKTVDAEGGDLSWAGGDVAAPTPGSPLESRVRNPEYAGEDRGAATFPAGSLRGGLDKDDPSWTTEYDRTATTSVRAASVAEPAGATQSPRGRPMLRDGNGNPITGNFGYVVDPITGGLYLFDPGEAYFIKAGVKKRIVVMEGQDTATVLKEALAAGESISFVHHTTALAGGDVAGAGRLTARAGQITAIDDESGHYKAEAEYLWQTVSWLAAQGMAVQDIDVTLIAKGNDPAVMLKGWQLQQTGGNEDQIRAKQAATTELGRPEKEREEERSAQRQLERERAARAKLNSVDASLLAELKAEHLKNTGCANLLVADAGGGVVYCNHDPDTDLPAKFRALIGTTAF